MDSSEVSGGEVSGGEVSGGEVSGGAVSGGAVESRRDSTTGVNYGDRLALEFRT